MNLLLIFTSVLMNCVGQLLMRKGMLLVGEVGNHPFLHTAGLMLTNIWLWVAMFCYGVSVIVWMIVLSKVEVSYAFPLGSIGYVLVALAGYAFLGEQVSLMRIVGILVICFGVVLVSRS